MNTAEIINSIKEHVAAAYTAVTGKNGTIPEQKNLSNLAAAIDSIQVGSSAENPYKARTYSEMNGYRTKNYGNAYVEYTGQRQFTRDQIQDSSMYDKLYFDFPRQIGWVETFDWDNPDSNWTSDGLLYKCIVLFNVTPIKTSDNTTEEAVPFSVYQMTTTRDSSDVRAGTVMYGIGFPSSFSWVSWGGTPDKEYSRTGYKLKITNVKEKYRYFIGDIISTTGKWSQIIDGMQFGYKHGTYKIDINSKTVDNFQKLDLVLEDGGGGTARKNIVNNYSYNLNSSYDYILKYSYEGKSSSVICKVGNFKFEGTQVTGANQLYNVTSDGYPDGIFFSLDPSCPLPYGWNAASIIDNFDLSNPKQNTPNKSVVGVSSNLYTLVGKTVTIEDISTAANMIYYTTLPSLSTPAAAKDIVKGKQAIDAEGNRIEGTLESGSSAENKLAQYASGELTEVTARDLKDITTINPYAFAFCSGLTSVTIPDNVTTIGSGAFYACPELSSVTISSGVTNMEEGAFYSCSKLTTVYYTGDVASWCKINGSGFESLMSNVTTLYINGQKVEGDLVIPDDVTNINNYAFYNCKDLTSLTIGNNVTSIGEYAFRGCSGLTSITIPNSVTNIGYSAFEDCTGLTDIVIPNSTVDIRSSAFSGCSSLTSVTGSSGVTSTVVNQARPTSPFVVVITSGTNIGDNAFRGYTGLTNITISDSVTSIGGYAFSGCSGLTNIIIPDSVTNIGYSAFENCSGLTSITIPNSMNNINDYTFRGCSSLTSVTIPNSINSIRTYAFENCTNLQNIYITDIAAWCNISGLNDLMYFNVGNKKNLYLNDELITSITIPDSVTSISSSAFCNCTELTSITIPSSVTSIGERAFYNCSGLTNITIPDSVTRISDFTFNGCINLTSITGPANVTSTIVKQAKPTSSFIVTITSGESINNSAFRDYTGLTNITIPDSIISIGDYAFGGCSGLTSITIPNSVTSISSGAFSDCSGLTDIIIPNNVTSIENSVFYNCESLTNITIPDNVISIGKTAFYNCNGLTSITVPDKVTSIGESAFSGCSSLTSITAPASIASTIANQVKPTSSFVIVITSGESINNSAFSGYTKLTSITIPNSVTSIGDHAFNGCIGLTDIVIPNGVTSIGKSAFYQCRGLTNITIGSSVASIGENAFYNCVNLRSIIVNEENTVYHSSGNCLIETSTKTLILGCNTSIIPSDDSVTSIYKEAFLNRTNLTNVTIGSGITSIGVDAFKGCYRLVEIYNKSSLTITAGNSDNGYIAYYAKNVYTTEDGSKLSTDENGYITYTNETEKILVAYTGTETNLVLPSDITGINQYTFADCKNLTNITIPDNVTSLGDSAFYNCTGLTNVTIGNSVTNIGKEAFYNCSGLTSIIIPDSVGSIGGNAFQGCAGLTNITISNTITKINTSTFYYCSGLTDVIIPNSVTYISNFAFANCSSLTSIVIPDGVIGIDNYAFEDCSGLTNITIGEGTTSIAPYAFSNCSSLTSIIVNEKNTKYHSSGNCLIETATKKLVLGCNTSIIPSDGSVTSINIEAFKGCSGLTSVVIPDGVTSIGTNAFENCSNLTRVIIPDSLTNINGYVFSNCINLMDITIGNGVNSIGGYAFNNCNKLTIVLYTGTEEQWRTISISSNGNSPLTSATIIYNYDGIERTYSFVSNYDQNINPITATYLISLPTLTRDEYYFSGWYDNETFEGEAVSAPYYSKDKTTLYAKWLTQEEFDASLRDGTSFEKAYIAKSGRTYDVNITKGGQKVYFTFTPTTSGSFTIQSTGSVDTYGELYSSTQSSLTQDDDGAGGRNFKITYNMTANTTYYIAARLYSSSNTGAFKVSFS